MPLVTRYTLDAIVDDFAAGKRVVLLAKTVDAPEVRQLLADHLEDRDIVADRSGSTFTRDKAELRVVTAEPLELRPDDITPDVVVYPLSLTAFITDDLTYIDNGPALEKLRTLGVELVPVA